MSRICMASGVGKEVTQILYAKNAKVYLAARSEEKTLEAIESIKATVPNSSGELIYLRLDLADLTTIKASAQEFLEKETKLHVLFNNAGVGYPKQGSKTKQGYELQLGVNCVVAPWGRFWTLTKVLVNASKTTAEGGTELARQFWDWTEAQVNPYL
ncbi:putative short-chain dehydrogenase protein [Phaeoacremonium minimum UCRPA7]|uniref:Putative short-chain dehydrogenase protein n=1 Tax=Phaeoacremonium minimum (strain UCR-PA7) TaxID=1286976 RepID=R8BEZ1_PHAM7|nr:putative short-chain dehydrogenase protein [Phaeoacremonium minimum UCRPA7]EON97868.1 putative short-chain dehydrogenase protein [Phaeoacremonium minimum UCRPA7]